MDHDTDPEEADLPDEIIAAIDAFEAAAEALGTDIGSDKPFSMREETDRFATEKRAALEAVIRKAMADGDVYG